MPKQLTNTESESDPSRLPESADRTDEFVRLIGEMVEATMLASRAFSQGRGLKTPLQLKRRTILFRRVVGRKPIDEELGRRSADTGGVV